MRSSYCGLEKHSTKHIKYILALLSDFHLLWEPLEFEKPGLVGDPECAEKFFYVDKF